MTASHFKKLKLDKSLSPDCDDECDYDYESYSDNCSNNEVYSSCDIDSCNEIRSDCDLESYHEMDSDCEINSCDNVNLWNEADSKDDFDIEEEIDPCDDIGSIDNSNSNNDIDHGSEVGTIDENDWDNDIEPNYDSELSILSNNDIDSDGEIEAFDEIESEEIVSWGETDASNLSEPRTRMFDSVCDVTYDKEDVWDSSKYKHNSEAKTFDEKEPAKKIYSSDDAGARNLSKPRKTKLNIVNDEDVTCDKEDVRDSSKYNSDSMVNAKASTSAKSKVQPEKMESEEDKVERDRIIQRFWDVTKRREEQAVREIKVEDMHHWGTKQNYCEKSATLKKLKEQGRKTVDDYKYYFERILRELGLEFRIRHSKTKRPADRVLFYDVLRTNFSFLGCGPSEEEALSAAAVRALDFFILTSS